MCRVKKTAHDGCDGHCQNEMKKADSSLPTCTNRAGGPPHILGMSLTHTHELLTSIGWFFEFSNNHGFWVFFLIRKNQNRSSQHSEEG